MSAIEKRGESSYRLTIACGRDKQGRKIQKRKTVDLSDIKPNKREEEAYRQWIIFKDEVEKGTFMDSDKITFEDFILKWLQDYAEPSLAPKTVFRYRELLDTRIIPALGHIKLSKLQPTHLTELYNNLREKGMRFDGTYIAKKNVNDILLKKNLTTKTILSGSNINESAFTNIKLRRPVKFSTAKKFSDFLGLKIDKLFELKDKKATLSEKTILQHHRLISSILTCAVQWGFILNNPALRVKAPRAEKKEARHFDIDQAQYLLELLEYEPLKYKTMITLALYGGMRMGELAALEWSDINFNTNILTINKSSQYLPEKGIFTKSTKNNTSDRPISLPASVINLIREYKVWQNGQKSVLGDLWNRNCNNMFTTNDGNPIFPSTISNWFLKFIRKHNKLINSSTEIKEEDKHNYLLDEVNFHGLRHTSATMLIKHGVDVTTVSKRLGHAKTSTTTDIYSHSLKMADSEAANKLENIFKKPDKETKKQG